MKRASAMTGTPAIMLGSIAEGISDDWATQLMAEGVAPLCGFANGLRAIEKAANYFGASADWRPVAARPMSR